MNAITTELANLATLGNNVILTVSLALIIGLVIVLVSEVAKND